MITDAERRGSVFLAFALMLMLLPAHGEGRTASRGERSSTLGDLAAATVGAQPLHIADVAFATVDEGIERDERGEFQVRVRGWIALDRQAAWQRVRSVGERLEARSYRLTSVTITPWGAVSRFAFEMQRLSRAATTLVLLPDSDGHVGAVAVAGSSGEEQVIDTAGQGIQLEQTSTATSSHFEMSSAELQAEFGRVLEVTPPPPARFVVHFDLGEKEPLQEFNLLLPEIAQAIREREGCLIQIVGHSDRRGSYENNYTLALDRAQEIGERLMQATGLVKERVQVDSMGESTPIVATEDGVREPRNRRVEITVR
ncbi:MAG: OmpA family protein [Magnetococcales bacterium]|nr:OmpA family protein [Magnetococcales bacterium]